MDKMVVEADCIPGGIDGEAPDRKQVLDKREIQGVLDFGAQIKSEGNEAFANENWEAALTRYCQGDEMLKNFAAEPHLKTENKELKQMHRSCLNNKANAALKMDQWQNALRASESALRLKMDDEKALFRKASALENLGRTEEAMEVLEDLEDVVQDFDDELKEAIMDDINERKEAIRDVERKAGKDYKKMFQKMADKEVFTANRFLADGTSPPPALTPAQENKMKRMKERQEWEDGKARYEAQQRIKDGKPLVQAPKEPPMPTPNKPNLLGYRGSKRSVTITAAQTEELLGELMTAYSDPNFQKKVHADAKAVMYEYQPFVRRLKKTAFEVQEPILRKWGFDESEEGLGEMMLCLSDHTLRNERLRKLAEETTVHLFGGEDGMYGMEEECG